MASSGKKKGGENLPTLHLKIKKKLSSEEKVEKICHIDIKGINFVLRIEHSLSTHRSKLLGSNNRICCVSLVRPAENFGLPSW